MGLTTATQDHYGAIKAHFLNLLNEPGPALNADLHGLPELNNRRIWLWKIHHFCQQHQVPFEKAHGICRRMTKGLALNEALTADTLKFIFIILKKNYRIN